MAKMQNSTLPLPIQQDQISTHAQKILQRLHENHHHAYIVGGGVRDLLLGLPPKDFDIATDAKPETIRQLFRNCRLIGKRFRLAHIYFGNKIIEVATFRSQHNEADTDVDRKHSQSGMILRDNVYGSLEEDVFRRDFTINALYYDIQSNQIIDHIDGLRDLTSRTLRLIGEPLTRYREDPVRMLRAIRFAAKLNLQIDPATEAPLKTEQSLLKEVSTSRLYVEVIKLLHCGESHRTINLLQTYGFFSYLFPDVEDSLQKSTNGEVKQFLDRALKSTDQRIADDKSVNPAFLFAAFLWYPMLQLTEKYLARGESIGTARILAMDVILENQIRPLSIPRRITGIVRDIWELQFRFEKIKSKKAVRLLFNRRFRAAYDFLLLRAEIVAVLKPLADFWTGLQETHADEIANMSRESYSIKRLD